MKAKPRQANALKKAAKVRRSSRAADALIAPWELLYLESPDERPEYGRQWKLSDLFALLSLGLEPDHVSPKVNRRKREARLTEPAALPVADAVSSEHPATTRLQLTKLSEFSNYLDMLMDRYRRLLARFTAAQSELEARVAVAESRFDSLLHDQPQVPHIDKSSVAASGASGSATPLHKVSGELPADLSGGSDPTLPEEGTKSVPSIPGPLKCEGTAGIPLGEEAPDPGREGFSLNPEWTAARLLGLNRPSRVPEPSRFTRLVRQCVAQARRVLHAVAMFVREL